jgi:MoxR-like ATPase
MTEIHPAAFSGTPDSHNAAELTALIRKEIGKALIGQETVVEELLIALLAGGHVLIEGVPGLGKTLLVRALARTFSGSHSRIQFTPDLMPGDVSGHLIFDMKKESFTLRKGPVFTHLLLADEINRAPAKTQSALLEVMQEQQVTIEGQSLPVPAPFMTIATQNPLEQEGTYPLPEAQLDRFLLKVIMDYPSDREEQEMVQTITRGHVGDSLDLSRVSTLVHPETILALQQVAAGIEVDQRVIGYAVDITRRTRDWHGIAVGAGPRGGIALVRAARSAAVLADRRFVTPDDIKRVTLPALRHRIILAPEFELDGQTTDQVLHHLMEEVPAPRS